MGKGGELPTKEEEEGKGVLREAVLRKRVSAKKGKSFRVADAGRLSKISTRSFAPMGRALQ